jgi:hypothetical protein
MPAWTFSTFPQLGNQGDVCYSSPTLEERARAAIAADSSESWAQSLAVLILDNLISKAIRRRRARILIAVGVGRKIEDIRISAHRNKTNRDMFVGIREHSQRRIK